ncbi:MAG TPA: PTS fructose transporter subunit IIA [Staphylococcus sp.]|uniref:PTS fructose transporter subunit IIA n=1 Tax=Mammaliicoccus vitulinus TaxID=71237 RepID=A0A2T4PVE7_9STAP|nr:PTS sugar transporter subunit IIA [Mammaliicoccus vitulinus]HAL08680.1 PTS fructose transporter subunit IIA [Staphylococcus sp.]MBO3078225.1 PTS sugar transporter subunit IIA [Mammaliicoccus vitulinus]PNZ35739.1 PTS fructose transporter subunit IIA [Mammaliicoccus vitulinus]PTI30422.1 PTS fructose transporter subunit IIA [Mammaliicoccus vitulinus]QRO85751.1 PTS sugar transporter subunit IIA [Mammaliicoccus vitulinus]
MNLKDVIDEKTILTELETSSREETLETLVHLFKQENYINDQKNFLDAVYKREAEGVTGIGDLVAIPHGKSKSVDKVGIAIAILKDVVDWPSLDDKGAKVVILLAVGEDNDNSKEHLKLLSLIARRLSNDEIIEQLLNSKEKSEVVSILSN